MLAAVEVHLKIAGVPKLTLPLFGNDGTGAFHIRDITGLGPVKATVNSRGYGALDGEYWTGNHIGKRNIVLTIGLNPGAGFQSVEDMRQILYGYLRSGNNPVLKFVSTNRPLIKIEGFVESCEPVIFGKDPEMQVSIICPKPFFTSDILKSVTGIAGINPLFIPFVYDSEIANGIAFQMYKGDQDYNGPITIEITDIRPTPRPFKIKLATIASGGYYAVDSHQGTKVVEIRSPVTNLRIVNLLGELTDDSYWPYVSSGPNKVRVISNVNAGLHWVLFYTERFGGI